MSARHLDRFLSLALTAFLGFALVSVPMAMLGVFRPLPVLVGTAAGWAILWGLWRRGEPLPEGHGQRLPVAVALLVVLAVTGLNVRFSSQHVLTNRDPGVYNATARWLADEGTLLIRTERAAYRSLPHQSAVRFDAFGFYDTNREDGSLYAQFTHLFPVTLAASAWLGGSRGMMKVNALLGAFALLAFFAFALSLLPPWAAVASVTTLAVNLIQVHFSRDAYAEITMQILIFGGLWMLVHARRSQSPARAGLAGLLLGASCMVHIDGVLVLIGVGAYVLYELWRTRRDAERRTEFGVLSALAFGAISTLALGLLDLRLFSPVYLSDLWPFVRPMLMVLAALALACLLLVFAPPAATRIGRWFGNRNPLWAGTVAIAIVASALVAYLLRPEFDVGLQAANNPFVEGMQRREGLLIDGHRTYAELSLRWLGLYLGPVVLWGGVLGLAFLSREVILGRHRPFLPFLALFMPMSALYIWAPHITPDHLWAMRRFLPLTIPGLIFACFWLLARAPGVADSIRLSRFAIAGATALAVWAVVFPVWVLVPLVKERTQVGLLAATEGACHEMPDDAVALLEQRGLFHQHYTQTVRAFCRLPTASAPVGMTQEWYSEVASAWREQGRRLFVLAPEPWEGDLGSLSHTAVVSATRSELEQTLNRRPTGFQEESFKVFLLEVVGNQKAR